MAGELYRMAISAAKHFKYLVQSLTATDAYKYQECYDIVEKEREKRKKRTENYDFQFSCHETWYAILGAALATAIFCGVFCVYENVGKEKKNNEKAPKSKGEEVNLIKS